MTRFALCVAAAALIAAPAQAFFVEDFEDDTLTYTTSVPEFSDGTGDFFTRTDGSNIGSFVTYNGVQGTSYFAAMDIDGESPSPTQSLTFNIDITGYTDLAFTALFAEDDDGSNNDWDDTDNVRVTYSIDNGASQNLFWLQNDGSTFNSAPFVDTDFDGIGDGAEITDTFTEYGAMIAGTGTTLDLVITMTLNSGDEDIAIDNVSITGSTVAAIPEPTAALFGSLLAGALGLTVARRR